MFTVQEALKAVQRELRTLQEQFTGVTCSLPIAAVLKAFDEKFGICTKSDGNIALFDYDTLRVKWAEPFGWVCRGLILDPHNDWNVVAFGLPKFFNHGESNAHPINWSTAHCLEKLDGSMVQRFWNPHTHRFEFSTRFQLHTDLAKNIVSNSGTMTWLELIEACAHGPNQYGPFVFNQPRNETWVMEVMSPLNKIVVQHRNFSFKFTARRNIETLEEGDLTVFPPNRVPFEMQFKDAEETLAIASTADGTVLEGFVVVDENFNRVKIKNPKYIALHRMKDGVNSVGAVISLAKSGDDEEITVHFPEYVPAFNMAKQAIAKLIDDHECAYEELKSIFIRKDFALRVQEKKLACPSLLYNVRDEKAASIRAALYGMRENAFIDLVKSQLPENFLYLCMLPPVQTKPSA